MNIVTKVLKSKYKEDHNELYILLIKRVYYYLDYSSNSCLSCEEVQNVYKDTTSLAGINFTKAQIATFIKKMNKNSNYDINCKELIKTIIKLRDHMFEIIYINLQVAARVNTCIVL